MYYKSANRGISFTKSGRYSVLFVFGIGMVAVNTGANGMFLFLSLGLALIVVSGLLSESTIKNSSVKQFNSQTIGANTPFQLTVYAINNHRHVSLYGLEFELHTKHPKLKFLRETKSTIGSGRLLTLAPDTTKPCVCECVGIPRGLYTSLNLILKTNFPFGFINKFKATKIHGNLVAAPLVNEELLLILSREFSIESSQISDDVEFHSHAAYQNTMASKHIDWKKSAGRPANMWVVKEYRANTSDFSVLIRTDWQSIVDSPNETEYEHHLVAIRTAGALAERAGRFCHLEIQNEKLIAGSDSIVQFLATLPHFSSRLDILRPDLQATNTVREPVGSPVTIFITGARHQWL